MLNTKRFTLLLSLLVLLLLAACGDDGAANEVTAPAAETESAGEPDVEPTPIVADGDLTVTGDFRRGRWAAGRSCANLLHEL